MNFILSLFYSIESIKICNDNINKKMLKKKIVENMIPEVIKERILMFDCQ